MNVKLSFTIQELAGTSTGRIKYIESRLRKSLSDNNIRNSIIQQLKDSVFRNLKNNQIEEDYYDFLCSLSEFINSIISG